MNHFKSSITLKEISKASGYSVSTVSKALNDKLDISLETRSIIKNIAKKYNYVPNNYAIGLRKKKTKTISVIIPQINKPFFSSYLYNIEMVANSYGYRVLLFQSFHKETKEVECIKSNYDGSVDGVIVISKNQSLANRYSNEINKLPIEYVHFDKNTSNSALKRESYMLFNKLLRQINRD